MTQIKKVKTSEGVQFFPITHTKAVIDDNGYTAESRMQAVQDVVNQAQMRIGSVPNDLAPTEGSTNWVTSGGVYNALQVVKSDVTELAGEVTYGAPDQLLDLSTLTQQSALIQGINNNWLVNYRGYKSVFIPVTPTHQYKIKANANYSCTFAMLVSDEYTNGTAAVFANESARTIIPPGMETIITAGSNANYLWILTNGESANTNTSPEYVVEYFGFSTIKEKIEDIKDEYENGGVEIDLTSGVPWSRYISAPTWNTSYYSSFINMSEYAGQEISITGNATSIINYAFTSLAAIGNNGGAITTIVSGRAIERIPADTTVNDIVPDGTSYLCLRRSSTTSSTDTDLLPASVMVNGTEIDVTGGTVLKASIVFPTWLSSGNGGCSIVPLPYGGKTVEITANDTYQCTYAFFKNGINGSANAIVSNFAKNSITSNIAASKTVVKEIPSDATHLYFFRDYSSSLTAVAYMPKKVFVRNNLMLTADNVRYSDYYNKDSNVQTVLESVDMDVRGVEVLDRSVFADIGSNDIQSPGLLLYKGDTVNIIGNTNYNNPIVRWYDGYSIALVPRTSGATSYTYTATEDMYVRLSSNKNGTFTINRANKRIDNIERACHDIPNKIYLAEMLGNARKAEYETIWYSYIGSGLTIKTGNVGFYTSPIALSAGETIHLYCEYNGWSMYHLVLSDAEGNLISGVEKTITSTHYTYRAKEDCYIVASGVSSFSVIIIGNSKIQDYMDDYDKRNNGTGILTLYANKQTENMLRQMTWGYNNNNGSGANAVKPLCILHCSDIHNNNVGESGTGADGVSNMNRIAAFYNNYKRNGSSGFIDDAIHTGDSVYSTAGGNFPWTADSDIAQILNVIGNHDLDGTSDWSWLYNKFFAPYIESWGVTVPDDAAESGKCYYYKDYTTNKVRLITLMSWGWLGSTSATNAYHAAQDTWFQGVLEDARTKGLTVVCARHNAPQRLDLIEGCSFNSWEYATHGDAGGATADRYAVSVDAFIQAGGDFACWICGHTHFDLVGTLQSYPDQLCIIVENASCWSYYDADRRVTGTLSQDCFNVMSIDTYCKRVNVMRIGSNFASALQHKGAFSYDYKNKKLLNCW